MPLAFSGWRSCVTQLRLGCSPLKSQYSETSVGRKEKVALFRRLATWEGGLMSKNQLSTADQEAGALKGRISRVTGWRWKHLQKQHCLLWQSSWNWSCSDLISTILILSTVHLQFQGRFCSCFLERVSQALCKMKQLMSWLQSGHHAINCFHLAGVSVSTKQLRGYDSEYYV